MFTKKTIRDIDVQNKRVLLRTDYNVPIENGKVMSDYRISESLPTIKALLEKNASIIITSHLGRPDGQRNLEYTLKPVADRLAELLGKEVKFAEDCIGPKAEEAARALAPGEILVLENVRFYPEEETNDKDFAHKLAILADVFVQDCFGVAHRAHASVVGVTDFLPNAAGLLLEKEVDIITDAMQNPERPLAAVVGGAKIADKLEVLNKLLDMADFVAIGGAMANTFLAAKGIKIGKSKYAPEELDLARKIIEAAEAKSKSSKFVFYLPHDVVVAKSLDKETSTRIVELDDGALISKAQSYPNSPESQASQVADDELILDIGPFSAAFIAGGVQLAKTVIWNGTLGVTEIQDVNGSPVGPFARGTETLIKALNGEFGAKPFTVVGGGDTSGYLEQRELTDAFGHVSTGGGASLELMAGRKLPGVEALEDK